MLAFCFSMNSDLSMLLRSRGVFGSMLITHDLRLITGNPRAQLNDNQKELLKLIGEIWSRQDWKYFHVLIPVERSLETCLFVWGSAGTGKTLILMEALKIKLSKLLSQGRRVRILATGFDDYITTELMNNFTTKYLVNMKNMEVMGFEKLCSELHIKYDQGNPLDTLNKVITSLSLKHPHIFTLLLGKGSFN